MMQYEREYIKSLEKALGEAVEHLNDSDPTKQAQGRKELESALSGANAQIQESIDILDKQAQKHQNDKESNLLIHGNGMYPGFIAQKITFLRKIKEVHENFLAQHADPNNSKQAFLSDFLRSRMVKTAPTIGCELAILFARLEGIKYDQALVREWDQKIGEHGRSNLSRMTDLLELIAIETGRDPQDRLDKDMLTRLESAMSQCATIYVHSLDKNDEYVGNVIRTFTKSVIENNMFDLEYGISHADIGDLQQKIEKAKNLLNGLKALGVDENNVLHKDLHDKIQEAESKLKQLVAEKKSESVLKTAHTNLKDALMSGRRKDIYNATKEAKKALNSSDLPKDNPNVANLQEKIDQAGKFEKAIPTELRKKEMYRQDVKTAFKMGGYKGRSKAEQPETKAKQPETNPSKQETKGRGVLNSLKQKARNIGKSKKAKTTPDDEKPRPQH